MVKQSDDSERKMRKISSGSILPGDIMAFVNYVKIKTAATEELKVAELDGTGEIRVQGRDLIESGFSADRFVEEEKVTKTRAAEILSSSYNRPFTVKFEKKDGSERTLRGRLIHPEPLMGRSLCEDLDVEDTSANRLRLVDHRSITCLIVDGVRYTLK